MLVAQVGEWVVEHLDFSEEPMQAPREVYSMLGAEGTWLDSFVDLELQWRSSRLLVAARDRQTECLLDAVMTLLLHVWSFRVWSDTRWLGFGHGARVLLFSLFLGLEDLAFSY